MTGLGAPAADLVALTATTSNDGVSWLPGAAGVGAFVVAAVNVGADEAVRVTADTGSQALPLTIVLCETEPSSGQCLGTPATSLLRQFAPGTTASFGVFLGGQGTIPLAPGLNRVFVRFSDAAAGVPRGATSVAVTTD